MSGTGAFFRLHPRLRHAIANELGWSGLRPVQELSTEAILDGCNTVVLAPTAGGKTEASLFPVLSRILSEDLAPVAALYVCPIRALLNNQEARVQRYARMVGLDAFKWHGDVSPGARARFLREPAHVLMITPESLEVMLIRQRTDARTLLRGLSAVVIDEVHAFAADDRGAHLVSILERLAHFCGHDVQRIGLSATVGNPDAIGAWFAGSSQRPYRAWTRPVHLHSATCLSTSWRGLQPSRRRLHGSARARRASSSWKAAARPSASRALWRAVGWRSSSTTVR